MTACTLDRAETGYVEGASARFAYRAGHGFRFQHADDFGHEVLTFL